jgi:hypothetical protein
VFHADHFRRRAVSSAGACGSSTASVAPEPVRLHMHWLERANPHHLGNPARIVAVTFVDLLRLQKRHHAPGLDTDHGQPGCS